MFMHHQTAQVPISLGRLQILMKERGSFFLILWAIWLSFFYVRTSFPEELLTRTSCCTARWRWYLAGDVIASTEGELSTSCAMMVSWRGLPCSWGVCAALPGQKPSGTSHTRWVWMCSGSLGCADQWLLTVQCSLVWITAWHPLIHRDLTVPRHIASYRLCMHVAWGINKRS